MSNFARCFPIGDGKMMCQHLNGSWIVFPASSITVKEKRVASTKKKRVILKLNKV